MASIDMIHKLDSQFDSNEIVRRAEFETLQQNYENSQKHIEKLYTREELLKRL